jgi:hypothetical protein
MMSSDGSNDESALIENYLGYQIYLDLRGNIVRVEGDRRSKIA